MFEWDEAKSRRNLEERDFEFAARIFAGDLLEHEDRRRDYSERRIVSVEEIDSEIFVVVHTQRGVNCRIISARQANQRERDAYRKAFSQRNS